MFKPIFSVSQWKQMLLNGILFVSLTSLTKAENVSNNSQLASATTSVNDMKIEFVPPPLEEATYSIGIYKVKSQKLVRQLFLAAPESAFKTALNGLVTHWDRKDDQGELVEPGVYDVRGYAMGKVNVEGLDSLGNDWLDENNDGFRVQEINAIQLCPLNEDYLDITATTTDGKKQLLQVRAADGEVQYHALLEDHEPLALLPFFGIAQDCENPDVSIGQEDSIWVAAGKAGLFQLPLDNYERVVNLLCASNVSTEELNQKLEENDLRHLSITAQNPIPVAVSASLTQNKIYLLEKDLGIQQVRGLTWEDEVKAEDSQSKETISHWKPIFEKTIETQPTTHITHSFVNISLIENPLFNSKHREHRNLKLCASFDKDGSYLQTQDGLRLRKVSDRGYLQDAWLEQKKNPSSKSVNNDSILFYQKDGAGIEEFEITNVNQFMAFDAGEVEINVEGN